MVTAEKEMQTAGLRIVHILLVGGRGSTVTTLEAALARIHGAHGCLFGLGYGRAVARSSAPRGYDAVGAYSDAAPYPGGKDEKGRGRGSGPGHARACARGA
jgi:hypothetical protein